MRVAHRHDYDTHAVIGGREVEGFEIAQTAEFFTVLSSTLYSNKPLAVAREVLCNGWDSHIVSGRQDTPIQVTITQDSLIIRDYGTGIPHKDIHRIYCVYGKSTKENDGFQTGGFGLGSKAPFAYSDHFTVKNHHAGLLTVHAISRGSSMTQGRPDRRLMVSVPTQEEGVEVSIPIRQPSDVAMFTELVNQIAAFGEMNIQINGKTVPTVPISEGVNGVFITNRNIPYKYSKIYVRYGNVLYPVEEHADYSATYRKITSLLTDYPSTGSYNSNGDWKMILQADPNTMSVTPSRESLEMTERTVATVKELLTDVLREIEPKSQGFREDILKHLRIVIDDAYQTMSPHHLLGSLDPIQKYYLRMDYYGNNSNWRGGQKSYHDLTSRYDIARLAMCRNYSKERIFQKIGGPQVIAEALLNGGGWRRPDDIKKYLRLGSALDHKSGLGRSIPALRFNKMILRPLVTKLAKDPVLNPKNLLVATPVHGHKRHAFTSAAKYFPDPALQPHLLAGVVIVTYSRLAYSDHYEDEHFPSKSPRLVYQALRTKDHEHKNAAVRFFEKLGFYVIDHADEHDAYLKVEEARLKALKITQPAIVKPPKPEGMTSLENLLQGGRFTPRGHLDRIKHHPERLIRTTTFECVFKPHHLKGDAWDSKFFAFGDSKAEDVVAFLGARAAICVNQIQYEAQIKKGAKDGYLYLVEKISEEILTNPRIRSYLEIERLVEHRSDSSLGDKLKTLCSISRWSERLRAELKLPDPVTGEDEAVIGIYKNMYTSATTYRQKPWEAKIQELHKTIQTWTTPPELVALYQKLKNNPMLAVLDLVQVESQLRNDSVANPDHKLRTFCEISVLNALKLK